ncbi:MAG: hypothetical protein LBD84_03525 [Campylobacteraceae bacterium]|nr:hypothetical protein [Campylobacteraceae bacterium]
MKGVRTMMDESNDFLWVFGANLAHYSGYGEKEFRFIPEIGIGWRLHVSLTYWYGLCISSDKT